MLLGLARAWRLLGLLAVLGPLAFGAARAGAGEPPSWPDTVLARTQALALIETLNAEILASRSATFTLEAWCAAHKIAPEPKIVAHLVAGARKDPTDEQRQRLRVDAAEPVKYRRVELACGSAILSVADNWYVPARLTPEMNRLLETTDTPFGKAVAPLMPTRQNFAAMLLWSPLPKGWEMGAAPPASAGGTLEVPAALFEHRALLFDKGNTPFSEVDEVYQRGILAFPPPGG